MGRIPPAGGRTGGHRPWGLAGTLWRGTAVLVLAPLAMTVGMAFAGMGWPVELLTHFRMHVLVCLVAAAVVFACCRRWRWLAVSGLAAVVHVPWLLPCFFGPPPAAGDPDLTLAVVNVNTRNRATDAVADWVRAEDPDLVLVVETDRRLLRALHRRLPEWRFGRAVPRADNFGIALLSRRRFAAIETVSWGPGALPSLRAELEVDGTRCLLVGTHPFPPVGPRDSARRDEQLRAIGTSVAEWPGPAVVLGDLNCTPWSPRFTELCGIAGLRDSAEGFGWAPTWPARLGPLGIPIDHCLVSDHWVVHDRRVGGRVGSDHRPLAVELSLKD